MAQRLIRRRVLPNGRVCALGVVWHGRAGTFLFSLGLFKESLLFGKFKIAHFPPTRACVFMADVYVLSSYLPRTTTLKRLCIKGVRVLLPPVPCETGDVREFLQNVRDFFCTRDAGLLRDRQSREADDSESRRKRRSASEYPRSFRFSKLSLSHLERYAGFESRDRAPRCEPSFGEASRGGALAYERDAMESEKSDGRFGVCSRESFRGWDVFDANV